MRVDENIYSYVMNFQAKLWSMMILKTNELINAWKLTL
jgi:hypothetical protein